MKIGEIKNKVREFKKDYNLKEVNYDSLSDAADDMGYTVVPFSAAGNEPDVEILVKELRLIQQIETLRGFTYADANYRLIFVNENLSKEEKTIVIAHELGHIMLGHMNERSIFGKDVTDEYEANQFANFLLKTHPQKSVIIGIAVFAVLVVTGISVLLINKSNEESVPAHNTSSNENETTSSANLSEDFSSQNEFEGSLAYTYVKTYLDSLPLEQPKNIEYMPSENIIFAYLKAPDGMTEMITNNNSEAISAYREIAGIIDDCSAQIKSRLDEMGCKASFCLSLCNDLNTEKVIYCSANGERVPNTPYY